MKFFTIFHMFFLLQGSIDPTTLGEAHGMLSDLLADSNLPPNVASTLKIISTMIAQPTFGSFSRAVNPMTTLVEKRCIPDETINMEISEQPDMRDDIQIQTVSWKILSFFFTQILTCHAFCSDGA